MSISLEISQKQLAEQLVLHYLPAQFDGDGEANVEEYFSNYTTKENGNLTNALRGYPIDGIEFEVPAKFTGVVFQENKSLSADRLLRVSGTFDKFTYWNYDKVPSAADALRQALQVISVSDELSKQVSAEEMDKEIKKQSQLN